MKEHQDGATKTETAGTGDSLAPTTGKTALNSISLVSALLTIFTFLKDSAEVADFMLQHVGVSVTVLVSLLLVFSGDLIPKLARRLARILARALSLIVGIWTGLVAFVSRILERRFLSYGRLVVVVLALSLVLFSIFRVYISGVYYVQLESYKDEYSTTLRVAELNGMLKFKDSDLRVQVTPPLGRSEYFAITMGPIFDKAEADTVFNQLRQLIPVRNDAHVRKVTLRNMWRKVAGVFG